MEKNMQTDKTNIYYVNDYRKSRTRIHWFVSYMYMIITALTNHNQSISSEMNFKSHSEGETEGYVQVHLSTQISFVAWMDSQSYATPVHQNTHVYRTSK